MVVIQHLLVFAAVAANILPATDPIADGGVGIGDRRDRLAGGLTLIPATCCAILETTTLPTPNLPAPAPAHDIPSKTHSAQSNI